MASTRQNSSASKNFAILVVSMAKDRFEEVSDNAIPTIEATMQKLTKNMRLEFLKIFNEQQRRIGNMPDMAQTKQVCADGAILCPESKDMCVISGDFIDTHNHPLHSEHHEAINKFCRAYDTILLAIREKKPYLVLERDVLAFLGLLQLFPRAQHEKFLRALKSEIEVLFQDGKTHERRMLAVNLMHQIGEEEVARKLHGEALRLKLIEEYTRNRHDDKWKITAFDLIRLGSPT